MILLKHVDGEWVRGTWTICSPVDKQSKNSVLGVFLEDAKINYPSYAKGIVVLINHAADHPLGPKRLHNELVRVVNNEHKIYEFRKGPLRVFAFSDGSSRLVICAAGRVKQGQKVDKSAVQEAIDLSESYRKLSPQQRSASLKTKEELENGHI